MQKHQKLQVWQIDVF